MISGSSEQTEIRSAMATPARPDDLAGIVGLLADADLYHDDLTPGHMRHFLTIREGDDLIGAVGLEVFGSDALLRSLVVAPGHRGEGLGVQLVEGIETHAHECAVTSLYLLTTTADRFFDLLGYERIDRASVPESIGATTEFVSFCPDSAVCMAKMLC